MKLELDLGGNEQRPNYFLRARRYFVIATAFFLVAIGLMIFLVVVQLPRLQQLIASYHTEETKAADLRKKAAELQDLAQIQDSTTREQIDTLLPSKKPLLQLINNSGKAAQDAGVGVVNVEISPGRIASGSAQLQTNVAQFVAPTPVAKINGVDVLTIGMTVTGTLSQINAFVQNIEKITPMSDITQLQLIVQDQANLTAASATQSAGLRSAAQYQAKLKIASFYFTQVISVSVDAALPDIKADEQAFLSALSQFQFAPENQQLQIQGGGLNDLFRLENTKEPVVELEYTVLPSVDVITPTPPPEASASAATP